MGCGHKVKVDDHQVINPTVIGTHTNKQTRKIRQSSVLVAHVLADTQKHTDTFLSDDTLSRRCFIEAGFTCSPLRLLYYVLDWHKRATTSKGEISPFQAFLH